MPIPAPEAIAKLGPCYYVAAPAANAVPPASAAASPLVEVTAYPNV
jgi:hypothetical protein